MAAYRRRKQRISERTPLWERPRGRLRLSHLRSFERQQAAAATAREGRAERREKYQRIVDERAADRARRKVPPTPTSTTRAPLPNDWMYRR